MEQIYPSSTTPCIDHVRSEITEDINLGYCRYQVCYVLRMTFYVKREYLRAVIAQKFVVKVATMLVRYGL